MIWSVRPFVRILIFFVIGILITVYIPAVNKISVSVILIISVTLLLVAISQTLITIRRNYNWLTGLIFGLLITFVGIFITSQKLDRAEKVVTTDKKKSYLACIVSNPSETNLAVKAILVTKDIDTDSMQSNIPQKVLCYFTKDSLSINLKYGDIIAFTAKPTAPQGPLNPEEFDYRDYLKQNGIHYTAFVKDNDWKLIGYEPSNPIIAFAGKLRSRILELLRQNGLSGDNYAVAAAVLLGYDDSMENDLKQDYIMAGAMHILCVSGLHVGIIYLVLNFLLGFMRNNRTNNILKAILLLMIVWAYATITGLSPSVQRASLMISVFIIGNLLNRNRDTYNTLAISALILLLINPYLIFNVGFQLSYAAVIGIITFHQPIYKLIYTKNNIVDKIWSISVLSFAAQLATFPIATYYFHFFPPWFWLTNLFTFPLSFLIIATGLVFVSTLWIPFIPKLVGWLLSGMIYLLNYVVGMVKFLPLSGIDHIYTSFPMIVMLYMLMLVTFIMLSSKKPVLLISISVIIGVILGLHTYHQYNILTQKKVVVYSINNHSAWDFIDGNLHVLMTDSNLTSETSKLDYHLKNSRTMWGLDNCALALPKNDTIINDILYKNDNFLLFEDLRIYVVDGCEKFYPTNLKLPLDLVIITGRRSTDITAMNKAFKINKVVIDSSVPPWTRQKIISTCLSLGLSCYDVNSNGALIVVL